LRRLRWPGLLLAGRIAVCGWWGDGEAGTGRVTGHDNPSADTLPSYAILGAWTHLKQKHIFSDGLLSLK